MEKWKKKTVELTMNMLIGENKNPSVVPYTPQKTVALGKDKAKYFYTLAGEEFEEYEEDDIYVTAITLNPSSVTLEIGESKTITAKPPL